jgi:superfamily II DNA/RNA helicase
MDHLERGSLKLDNLRHVILDEADEMLKMGFAEDIEKIFSYFDVTTNQVHHTPCNEKHSR